MSDNRYYVNYAGPIPFSSHLQTKRSLAALSHLTVFLAFYPPPLV